LHQETAQLGELRFGSAAGGEARQHGGEIRGALAQAILRRLLLGEGGDGGQRGGERG
jgi:hypothetical protein